jgi:hypothetical protein
VALWLNRSQALAARNGTTSHTLDWSGAFTATAGRLLVLIVAGPVTTTTPAGWTLHKSAINLDGLYVFVKTAAGGETSVSVTHNSSNFPVQWVIYQFPAGSAVNGTPGGLTGQILTSWAQVTAMTGTNTVFGVAAQPHTSGVSGTISVAFTGAWIEDVDVDSAFSTTDGAYLAVGYQDAVATATATPTGTITQVSGSNGERVTFAVTVGAGATPTTLPPRSRHTNQRPGFAGRGRSG